MKSKQLNASYSGRAKLAKSYGITNYQGTSAQNSALLSKLKSGIKPAKINTYNCKLTTKPILKQATTTMYTVKKGDTLSGIAHYYKVTVSEI
jgi:LysM repeat protein